jgi:flavin reductase (DIM6/NTAB) family NADH-FMN oxidoreductase RutF
MKQKQVIPAGNEWRQTTIADFKGSPSQRIAREWMLITAGDVSVSRGNWNTMTASWGSFGELWGRDAAFMWIRPSRHTFEFANAAAFFTLSFFPPACHDALALCGSRSGRDIDKAASTGLTPIVFDSGANSGANSGAIGFLEASENIVCKKLYTQDIDPSRFLDPSIDKECYQGADYHRLFVGEILSLFLKGM